MTAISTTGQKVVVLSKRKFWVFDTSPVSLICTGEFTKGRGVFRYGIKDNPLTMQQPIINFDVTGFSAVALSDVYLAIASPGRVTAFIVEGEFGGRLVVSYQFASDPAALVEQLAFSPDGKQLLALLRADIDCKSHAIGLIFRTDTFPKENLDRSTPQCSSAQEIVFNTGQWNLYRPTGVSFSSQGTMVAICTNRSGFRAGIQLLRKTDIWHLWGGLVMIEVFQCDSDQRDWTGYGLTGISL